MNVGTKLGPYEIVAPIGAGGMGEVYKARDTKLDRDVAIKVLPAALAQDPERLARFEREAKVLAALNHPNIAQIYGLEQRALVMELVEGETLKGPLPVETALNYAKQIADALEAAHEKGITHRDLKPANIMITPAGVIKVLDFGLAAVAQDPVSGSTDPSNSPTLTMRATQAGMIMGTAAYMSPEQAAGKPVDKRADIWSFGVVLFELLTGRQLFGEGETISHTLADVLRGPIDFDKLPKGMPRSIRDLLRRCLDRDVRTRLRDIGEARIVLARPMEAVEVPQQAKGRAAKLPWVAAVVLVIFVLALGFVSYRHIAEEPPRVLKMSVLPPDKATLKADSPPAVSPDGRKLAFIANLDGKDSLWVRDLDSLAARALTGTEGADRPFWSPDSRSIGFFADLKLKKIDVVGGPALTLCAAVGDRGGTWSKNDVIVFGTNAGGTFRVPAAGGSATPVTIPDQALGETGHRFPWFLPDGRHFLYTATNRELEKIAIFAADIDSKDRKHIMTADSNVVFTPPGNLLFVRERTLMAQSFDVRKLQTTGDAIPIAEQVDTGGTLALNMFSASQNGVLAYTSGSGGGNLQITWFDHSGKVMGTIGTPGFVNWPAISPDGNTVAFDREDPQTGVPDIWLHDLARGTDTRFTFGPRTNNFPVWSPDGGRIAFYSTRDGLGHTYQKAVGGTAREEVLDKVLGDPPRSTRVCDWSRDGRYVIEDLSNMSNKTKADVWVLPLFGDRKAFPYLQTEFNERNCKLSPNGQWLAYASDETKRYEIYVQTFPTPGGKWQVSTNGGTKPVWGRDGKELYFIGGDGKLMAAETNGGAKFEAGVPKALFDPHIGNSIGSWFDVSKDGRFLIPVQLEQSANAPMTVVINWTGALKK